MGKTASPIFFYEHGNRMYIQPPLFRYFIMFCGLILIIGVPVSLLLDWFSSSRSLDPWYEYLFWGGYGFSMVYIARRKKKNPYYTFVKIDEEAISFKKEGEEDQQIATRDIERSTIETPGVSLTLKSGETVEIPFSLMDFKAVQKFKEAVKRSTNLRFEKIP